MSGILCDAKSGTEKRLTGADKGEIPTILLRYRPKIQSRPTYFMHKPFDYAHNSDAKGVCE